MENTNSRYYEFGEFRLDARRRILFQNGNQIPLSGRIFDLLLVMVQNEGRILDHEELLDKVWEGMFVEQSNLKKSVSALRQILGEQAGDSLYIKTVPRRGYSFVAPVRAMADDPQQSGAFYLSQTDTEIIVEEEVFEDPEEISEKTETKTLTGHPPKFSDRFSTRQVLFAIAAIFLLGAAFLLLLRPYLKTAPLSFSVENVRFTKLSSDGKTFPGGVSPDGNYYVYVTGEKDGLNSLWVKQIATGSSTRIIQPVKAAFYSLIFSPDGNYVYYTLNHRDDPKQNGIYKVPSLGGASVRVTDKGVIWAFTVDGKQIIIARKVDDLQNELLLADFEGQNERRLAIFNSEYRVWSALPSPDGENLLISLRRQYSNKVTYRVTEIPLTGSPENPVLNDIIPEQERAIRLAVWLPDKSSLLLGVREANAEIVQFWQYSPASGEWRRVTNDNNFYGGVSFLKDGKSFISSQTINLTSLWAAENGSTDFRQITSGSGLFLQAEWMLDGRILLAGIENQQETLSITSSDGSGLHKLTAGNDGIRLKPRLSSGDKYINFVSARSGTTQIWRMDLDGKNQAQMTNTSLEVYDGAVLSDGQTVIYEAYVKPKGWIMLKQTPDAKTIELTDSEVALFDISPDEKTLACFVKDEKTGRFLLNVRSLEDGAVLKTFDISPLESSILKFTPDGQSLAYNITKNGISEIFVQSLEGGEPKQITDFRADLITSFDWSPDGRKLLVIRSKGLTDAIMIQADKQK